MPPGRSRPPRPPLHPFEAAVARFCREERLFREGDRVVVAFSGGPDSMALLHALAAVSRGPGPRLRILAAHLDHALRPESGVEAAAARKAARALGVPFRSRRLRNRPANEQEARRRRYLYLAEIARRTGARKVALAHHLDDRAETVLHRLLQGATLRGLAGIPLRRPLPGAPGVEVVRPLFGQDRAAILAYLRDRGASYSEDPTNLAGRNARAGLRTRVLPAMRGAYPQARASLLRLADLAREASSLVEAELGCRLRGVRRSDGAASVRRASLAGLSEEGVRRSLGRLLGAAGLPRTSPPLAAVRRLVEALESPNGKARRIPVFGKVEVEVRGGEVRLSKRR